MSDQEMYEDERSGASPQHCSLPALPLNVALPKASVRSQIEQHSDFSDEDMSPVPTGHAANPMFDQTDSEADSPLSMPRRPMLLPDDSEYSSNPMYGATMARTGKGHMSNPMYGNTVSRPSETPLGGTGNPMFDATMARTGKGHMSNPMYGSTMSGNTMSGNAMSGDAMSGNVMSGNAMFGGTVARPSTLPPVRTSARGPAAAASGGGGAAGVGGGRRAPEVEVPLRPDPAGSYELSSSSSFMAALAQSDSPVAGLHTRAPASAPFGMAHRRTSSIECK